MDTAAQAEVSWKDSQKMIVDFEDEAFGLRDFGSISCIDLWEIYHRCTGADDLRVLGFRSLLRLRVAPLTRECIYESSSFIRH